MPKKHRESSQSLFARLTRLFKNGPVVRRKVRTQDTTIGVPDKTMSSGMLLFQKSQAPSYATITANAYNLTERLMRYQDFGEMEYCLHGDTKIAVPEGYKTLVELSSECEGNPDRTFIVYSYDHNLQRIVPALGKQARQTRVDEAYTVTFDNGQKIVGTPNHRLMKRDGTFCKIEDLKPGDAMMPFYRRDLFNGCKEEGDGYRWIYTMDRRSNTNGWVAEHRVIGEMLKGSPLTSDEVIHHRNFIRFDNDPSNLEVMSEGDHRAFHARILNGIKWSKKNSEWIDKFKADHSKFMTENNPVERKDITFGRILELAEKYDFNSKRICEALDTDPNVIKRRLRRHGYDNFETFAKAYNPDWHNAGWNNRGEKNPRYKKAVTFERICNNFSPGMTKIDLASLLDTTTTVVDKRIRDRGYKDYTDFSTSYQNLKVVSVEYHGVIPLYDLTVDGYKNFATDSVISHNTPEIASALDIYADESVATDEKGRVLHIYSDNPKIKTILEDLHYGTLNVEFNLRPWVRNLCKFGDMFTYIDVSPDYGVLNVFPIPVNEIEREENYDPEDPFAVRFRWVTLGNRIMENWEVGHFRLLGNDMFLPYGSSVIEPARRVWRQLILIEDAMLVYRIVRAPERRVFYIDVANIPTNDVPNYMEQVKQALRTDPVIDKAQGRVDLRYNTLAVDSDYVIPVRGGDTGTKIETLAGGQNAAAVEDVQYIQKKLFSSLKIPKAYLGYDELLCLTGDTSVPLLDGRTLRIDSLSSLGQAEFDAGIWTYSCDVTTGRIIPGRITKAWKTKDIIELYEVTLDDGSVFRCTENHPFLCRDGSYRRADELAEGQSLMPLYRKLSSRKERDFQDGYEKYFDNADEEWKFTHRMVNEAGLVEDHESRLTERSYVIHHVDHDKRNNSPRNLVKMGKKAHALYHSTGARANLLLESSRDKLRSVMNTPEYRASLKSGTKSAWDKDDGSRRVLVASNNTKYKRRDINLSLASNVAANCSSRDEFYKKIGFSYTGFERTCERQGVHHGEWLRENIGKHNHKVISVRVVKLDKPTPVYDLTVEGTHNFAIQSEKGAIFVHNSSKATLAQEDIRFSRTINVIQKTVISELNKISIIHLFAHGFRDDDLMDFTLRLSNPSTVAQQQKLELIKARFEIAGSAPEGLVDRHYIQTEVLGLNDEEIEDIDNGLLEDAAQKAELEAAGAAAGEGGGGGGGGGADLFGGGGDIGGGAEEELGGEEGGGEESGGEEPLEAGADPDEEPKKDEDESEELLLSVDDPDDRPVKAKANVRRAQYNKSRRDDSVRKGYKGPNFGKMTGNDNRSMEDPNDTDYLKSVARMTEENSAGSLVPHRSLSYDMMSLLERMSSAMGPSPDPYRTAPGSVIVEGIDFQDEIDSVTESPDVTVGYEELKEDRSIPGLDLDDESEDEDED